MSNDRRERAAATLFTLGVLDEQQLDALDAQDDGKTWAEALQSVGVSGEDLENALDLVETTSSDQVTREGAGRYTALRPLGEGGMGSVTLVDDAHLHRRVARKELLVQHPAIELRFLREARVTGQLEHPGIIPIYELGRTDDGTLYYTMKEIRGDTLREALDRCEDRAARLSLLAAFVDACLAVGYAHSKGIVHRDLKPENVMVGAFGETLVLDWGLARVSGEEDLPTDGSDVVIRSGDQSDLTRDGTVLGTPRYMSPEQAAGDLERVDARSDVWSLGVILHEIVTGDTPFQGPTSLVLDQVKDGLVPSPLEMDRTAPPDLVSVVMKAMSRLPEDRYPSAVELAEEVERWRTGGSVHAHDYTVMERARRAAAANRAVLVGAAMVVLAVLASTAFFVPRVIEQRNVAEREAEAAKLRARRLEAWGLEVSGEPTEALALLRDSLRSEALSPLEQLETRAHVERLLRGGADVRVLSKDRVEGDELHWSSRGSRLAWADDEAVVVVDPESGSVLGRVPAEAPVTAFAFGPDDRTVFLGTAEGGVRQVAFLDLSVKAQWELEGEIVGIWPDPGGDGVWVNATEGNIPSLHRLEEGETRPPLTVSRGALGARPVVDVTATGIYLAGSRLIGLDWKGEDANSTEQTRPVLALDGTSLEPSSSLGERAERVLPSPTVLLPDEPPLPPSSSALRSVRAEVQRILSTALSGDLESDATLVRGRLADRVGALRGRVTAVTASNQALLAEGAWWLAEAGLHVTRLGFALRAGNEDMDDVSTDAFEHILRRQLTPELSSAHQDALVLLVDALERAEEQSIDAPWVEAARRRLRLELPTEVVVTGSTDDHVYVWVPGAGLKRSWPAHQGDVLAVAVAPDGRIASGGSDARIRVWDSLTGAAVLELDASGPVQTLDFAGPDRLVSQARGADHLQVWEASRARHGHGVEVGRTHLPLRTLYSGTGTIEHWQVSPDDEQVAIDAGGEVRVFRLGEPPHTRRLPEGAQGPMIHDQGTVWVGPVAFDGETLDRIDRDAPPAQQPVQGPEGVIGPVVVLSDDLVLAGQGSELVGFTPDGERRSTWFSLPHEIQEVAVADHAPHGALATREGIHLFSTATRRVVAEIPWTTGQRAGRFAWTSQGLLVLEPTDTAVRLYDGATGEHTGTFSVSSPITNFVADDHTLWMRGRSLLHRTSLADPPVPETNLRVCAASRIVAVLPFPRRQDLEPGGACRRE